MKLQKLGLAQSLILGALGLCGLEVGCKDDEPCDPWQIVQNSQCYPAPAKGGETGIGGAPFGSACKDSTDSSDCGGVAPICADLTKLGQSVMCTQINCSPGEANAGVCPSGFSCFAFPGYPSVCTKE